MKLQDRISSVHLQQTDPSITHPIVPLSSLSPFIFIDPLTTRKVQANFERYSISRADMSRWRGAELVFPPTLELNFIATATGNDPEAKGKRVSESTAHAGEGSESEEVESRRGL